MFKDDPANGTIRKEVQVLSSEKISATFVKKDGCTKQCRSAQ